MSNSNNDHVRFIDPSNPNYTIVNKVINIVKVKMKHIIETRKEN